MTIIYYFIVCSFVSDGKLGTINLSSQDRNQIHNNLLCSVSKLMVNLYGDFKLNTFFTP